MKSKLPVSSLSLLCVIIAINGYSAPGGPLHNRQFQIINPAALSGGNFGDAWDVNVGYNGRAISDSGLIVGEFGHGGYPQAFSFDIDSGSTTELPRLGNAPDSMAIAVNCHGQIVGEAGFRGVLWERNRIYELNDLLPAGTGFRTLPW